MTLRQCAWGLLAGSLAVGGGACWLPAETGQKMQQDIIALQRDQQQSNKDLEEQRARLDEQMERAAKQIDEVAVALADLRRAARGTDAEFGVKMERLVKELQELRGTLELVEYRLGKVEGRVEGEGSLSERVEKLEAELENVATAPPPKAPEPKDPKALLAYGKKLAKQNKIGDARGVFRDVIKRWPTQAGVTDEAYYRLGDMYLDDKKYRSALQEYIKVAEKFATGNYAAGSLYKIGICSLSLGNLEDAQIFFAEVVKNHRKTSFYKESAKRLDEVKKRLAKEKSGKKSSKKKKGK